MPTDWQTIALSRGLHLSDHELTRLGSAMEALEQAYLAMAAPLTIHVQPATTIAEEAVEAK
jgi:hypothetical protein